MRHQRTLILGLLAMLVLAVSISAAPKLISYQGKATDAAGQPVTDGSHPVQFHIYDKVNNLYWSESATVTTVGGLFSHNLGSVTPLIPGPFAWRDSLFLQVTFEGQIQLPRTTFTAAPYALAVSSIDGSVGGIITGDISVHSNPADDEVAGVALDGLGSPSLWMKDADGHNRVKLDAATRSLEFIDEAVTSTPARITSAGDTLKLGDGKLRIRSNLARVTGQLDLDGTTDCWINPNMTGVSSVYLPDDGINNREIKDEPGITQAVWDSIGAGKRLPFGSADFGELVSVNITIPSAGYIISWGMAEITVLPSQKAYLIIDETFDPQWLTPTVAVLDNTSTTSVLLQTANCQRVFYKASAGTYTLRLGGKGQNEAPFGNRAVLTAMFIPTSYGSVETTVSAAEAGTLESATLMQNDGTDRYKVDLRELELKAARAEAEAERAKRELLEAQMETTEEVEN